MALKNKYVEENHDGKLFRVRDKNHGKGKEYIVWAENLPYEAAHTLKERICGQEKSKTARIEEMTIPLEGTFVIHKSAAHASSLVTSGSAPDPDPQIQAARKKALAAASGPAQQAQARAGQVIRIPQPEVVEEIMVPENIEDELDDLASGGDAELA